MGVAIEDLVLNCIGDIRLAKVYGDLYQDGHYCIQNTLSIVYYGFRFKHTH